MSSSQPSSLLILFSHILCFCAIFQLPKQDELKTVVDKVKDFFGDAKESFGKMTFLNAGDDSPVEEDTKEAPKEKTKEKSP